MILRTVASLSAAIVNGTHHAAHKVGKKMVAASLAITAATALKHAVSKLVVYRLDLQIKHTHRQRVPKNT
jgi:hypothetical protein